MNTLSPIIICVMNNSQSLAISKFHIAEMMSKENEFVNGDNQLIPNRVYLIDKCT